MKVIKIDVIKKEITEVELSPGLPPIYHELVCENCVSMTDIPIMKNVIEYNKVDVLVLYEIITYLRDNHIKKKESLKRKRSHIDLMLSNKHGVSKKRKRYHSSTESVGVLDCMVNS